MVVQRERGWPKRLSGRSTRRVSTRSDTGQDTPVGVEQEPATWSVEDP